MENVKLVSGIKFKTFSKQICAFWVRYNDNDNDNDQ